LKALQFEAVKVALKQNKDGYVLTLCLHPDEIPEELMRDFVGSRYQVVMVRLTDSETPMDRDAEFAGSKAVKVAAILCRDPKFWKFLNDQCMILEQNEKEATEYLRTYLGVQSRSDLKVNQEARNLLDKINKEFQTWLSAS
jgi:hypothetical protein